MWLSIVIPAYNCQKYLAACLDSILQQGLRIEDYEVCIIDDGSDDETFSISSRYQSQYSNFHVVKQSNAGVGMARNHGLQIAQGDYVLFIDADDWLLDGGLSILKSYVDSLPGRDMYTFWAHTVDNRYDASQYDHIRPHKLLFDGNFDDYAKTESFGWSACLRIISRKFLTTNNLYFSNHRMGEDMLFITNIFHAANGTIASTSLNIYRYRVNQQSAVNRVNTEHNKLITNGYIDIFRKIHNFSLTKKYALWQYDNLLDDCRRKGFTRMLSGCSKIKDIKDFVNEMSRVGMFPCQVTTRTMKLINFTIKSPHVIFLLGIMYRKIFLPYIKPHISRN